MQQIDKVIKSAVKTVKKKATILRLFSDLDDVVLTIYTDKEHDEVVIKAKIKEETNESE